jgi:NosR/NirI family nitrous oxide reductase transcriptional regulator
VTSTDQPRRLRSLALQSTRVLLFMMIIALIRVQHNRLSSQRTSEPLAPVDRKQLRNFFPKAVSVAEDAHGKGRREVLDASGKSLGYVLQTSPEGDHRIGFSGPTNTLIAFAPDDRIVGLDILSSGDTRDHVAQVVRDDVFFSAFKGLTWEEASATTHVAVMYLLAWLNENLPGIVYSNFLFCPHLLWIETCG